MYNLEREKKAQKSFTAIVLVQVFVVGGWGGGPGCLTKILCYTSTE